MKENIYSHWIRKIMFKLFKLIVRYDYIFAPNVMDNPGKIISLITNNDQIGWEDIGEKQSSRTVYASQIEDHTYKEISVSPQALVVNYENSLGITPSDLINSDFYKFIDNVISEMFSFISVKNCERIGIRFFGMHEVTCDKYKNIDMEELPLPEFKTKTEDQLNKSIINSIEKNLGGTKDIGITFEGQHDDGIKYRLAFGPAGKNDMSKVIKSLNTNEFDNGRIFSYSIDMDLYENSASIVGKSFKQWAKTKWQRLEAINDEVMGELDAEH